MKCKDCPYFYDKEFMDYMSDNIGYPMDELEERFGKPQPTCNYQWNDGYAPCEVE